MVARIVKGKDIIGLLKYNEKEKSSVLYSQYINDAKDTDAITFKDKAEVFQAYIRLNPGITKPTFHVSLNPDPADKLGDEQLSAIGRDYMEGMHYGDQPYLIYKHEDIDRVHIHIVSVNIRLDGKVVDSSHERYRSEAVRKQIEAKYHLVKAGEKVRKGQHIFEPIDLAALEYGKTDTKSAIANVVRSAVRDYRFSSLAGFRALLNHYHVAVDEVKDGADKSKTIGLMYAVCNQEGEKLSPRIKASRIDKGVCQESLEKKFARESREAQEVKARLAREIGRVLDGHTDLSREEFKAQLAGRGIDVLYQPGQGQALSGAAFVDRKSRTVVSGRSLDPEICP